MATAAHVKVADQVWIALALLTREHPERDGFAAGEIISKVTSEFGRVSPGIATHVSEHCVASKAPRPGRYCMISKTPDGRNRLFVPGDPYHPAREGAKTRPNYDHIPERYHELLEWYDVEYSKQLKVFGPEAYAKLLELLKLSPPEGSKLTDVSENVDYYLNEAWFSRPTRTDKQ